MAKPEPIPVAQPKEAASPVVVEAPPARPARAAVPPELAELSPADGERVDSPSFELSGTTRGAVLADASANGGACIVTEGKAFRCDLKDLSPAIVKAADLATTSPVTQEQLLLSGQDLEQLMAGTEKRLIETALTKTKGQVSASADLLGLTRQGLYKKMKRLGIDTARFQETRSRSSEDPLFQLN